MNGDRGRKGRVLGQSFDGFVLCRSGALYVMITGIAERRRVGEDVATRRNRRSMSRAQETMRLARGLRPARKRTSFTVERLMR